MRHEPHDATIAKRIEVPSPFSCQTSLQYAPWLGHREKQRSGKAEKKMPDGLSARKVHEPMQSAISNEDYVFML